jgi:lysophospholipase L1-like esterase
MTLDQTSSPPTRDPAVRLLVQFQRMEQLLSGLPGARDFDAATEARALGVPLEVLEVLRTEFRGAVRKYSSDLLADERVRRSCARLRLDRGDRIVCLGDSMTADFQSWAEILAAVLGEARPELLVRNEGRSGDTTTDLLSRFAAAVPPHRPSVVVVLIGANDGRQHAPWPSEPEVSDQETGRNVVLLQSMIEDLGARSVWLTPPPVLDERVRTHAVLGAVPTRWDDAASGRKAAVIASAARHSIDLRRPFVGAGTEGLLLEDGLHPSGAGQALIAAEVLAGLADL